MKNKRSKFFAKIDEVKSELEVKQELDLLFHLRKQGFPCLQPVKTKTGRYATNENEIAQYAMSSSGVNALL